MVGCADAIAAQAVRVRSIVVEVNKGPGGRIPGIEPVVGRADPEHAGRIFGQGPDIVAGQAGGICWIMPEVAEGLCLWIETVQSPASGWPRGWR